MLQGSTAPMIAVDRDPRALKLWERLGAETMLESEFELLLGSGEVKVDQYNVVPCDEYLRARHPGLRSDFTTADCGLVHNKRRSYDALAQQPLSVSKLPARFPRTVTRPARGAGSHGLHVAGEDTLTTQYIEPVHEYVVDFNTTAGITLPRETHYLVRGGDTHCTLIGRKSPRWARLVCAAAEVSVFLGIEGVGNAQFIEDAEGELWFVEASARLSGSSWLNLEFGWNLLTGKAGTELAELDCTTRAGGIIL